MSSMPLSREAAALATKRRLRRWPLSELIECTGAELVMPSRLDSGEVGRKSILGASIDTRRLRAGEVFVPLPGRRVDGHEFLGEAQAHGAAACFVRRDRAPEFPDDAGGPLLLVEDPESALTAWGVARRLAWSGTLVGVTGSNGKTTTKDLLALCLETSGLTHSTEGNLNNHLGVPLTLTGLSDDHRFAVVEMGMSQAGEIARLAEWARPHAGIITHVGHAHLLGVGSFEGVCRAKAELAGALSPDGFLVLPAGVPALEAALDEAGYAGRRVRFALSGEADLVASDLSSLGPAGVSFRVEGVLVRMRLAGLHNVSNALAALLCARELGVEVAAATGALSRAAGEPGRMEIVTVAGVSLLLDHYNANPESMQAALEALRSWPARRRFAVFGDMLELGDYAAEGHYAVGQAAAFVDGLYLVGEMGAHVAQGAVASGLKEERVRTFSTHRELADGLAPQLAAGDALLIKGSRGARLEAVSEVLRTRLEAGERGEG